MITRFGGLLFLAAAIITSRAAAPDIPFYQDRSEKYLAEGELAGATMKKVHFNKDGIVYVLTDRGMARLFGNKLALDRSFRPPIGKKIVDSAVVNGEVYYLLEDALLSNGFAGTNSFKFSRNRFDKIPADPFFAESVTLSGRDGFGHIDPTDPPRIRISTGFEDSFIGTLPRTNRADWVKASRGIFHLGKNSRRD